MTSDFCRETMRSPPQAIFAAQFALMFPNCGIWFIVMRLIRRVEVSAERCVSVTVLTRSIPQILNRKILAYMANPFS